MTAIFDVLVNTDDIVVLGGPSQIDVSVDVGPQGDRGAKFFVGSGNPNTLTLPETPQLGDFFVNSSTASDYGWLYIYTQTVSNTNSWEPALKLQPAIYSSNVDATFDSNGLTTIEVLLSDIVSDITITDASRYIVQITPIHSSPVAVSINTKTVSSGYLNIDLEAVEYFSSTWQNLQGAVSLGVTISVV
jgi:hypothetical protein